MKKDQEEKIAKRMDRVIKDHQISEKEQPINTQSEHDKVCQRCFRTYPSGHGHVCTPVRAETLALSTQVGGDHYKILGKYQPWEIIDVLGLDFFEGSVLKYLLRWRKKNGVEDLRKAIHTLQRMIEREEAAK